MVPIRLKSRPRWPGLVIVGLLLCPSAAIPVVTPNQAAEECSGTWTPVKAADYVKQINPGWNVGNTLDAIPDEGSWNNAPVVLGTLETVKAAGFKSVRIPVTYGDHYTSGSPDWTIDPAWLQRVSDVVDMATSIGLYALTNIHHDSWEWADVSQTGANLTMIEEKMYASWLQIGKTLACKSEMVSLETINEPPATTAEDGAEINKLNEIFLKALADSGGFNPQRMVTLVGGSMDSVKTSQWFVAPENMTNPWALQFHYYNPYDFIFGAWGKTTWGSDEDKAALTNDLTLIKNNFTDVPFVIGEWSASSTHTEAGSSHRYFDYFIRQANAIGAATMLWDNGDDQLDRNTGKWRDPVSIDILMNAVKGVANSLPDGTTDGAATTQQSSAYIFHKVGEEVTDQDLGFLLNGNTLESIHGSDGSALDAESDYTTSGSTVTFKAGFLSKFLSPTADPGSKTSVTLKFSAGASLNVELVQWDTPALASTSSKAVEGADLHIPITYKGLSKVAAVKIVGLDGTYLVDDWTQYLGPLQQGRGTLGSQYNWDNDSVIITSDGVAAVVAAKQTASFTFEFYPRVPQNAVNYTLEV